MLVPNDNELPGLILAFENYATGKYGDNGIAELLNENGYVSKTGRPFSKDTIRDLLQNQTYLGKVRYQRYTRKSNGERSYDAPVEWYEGQHDAVIEQELFDRCMAERRKRSRHMQAIPKYNPYLLRGLIYCHQCSTNRPEGQAFRSYGKMRPQSQRKGGHRYYRCRAHEMGYECSQRSVRVDVIEQKVVNILKDLKPPKDWRAGIDKAVGELLGEKGLDERLIEIQEKIKRMDVRWDNGFVTDQEEFMKQRLQLQLEIEQLTPVPDEDFKLAVDTQSTP